jgi:heme-degrading monooxygenase HmoA
MTEPVPALVTFHLWRVAPARVPQALLRMAIERERARRTPGVRFAKLLGTGRTFTPRGADPTRWALLTTWSSAEAARHYPTARAWDAIAEERWRVELRPLSSRGRWSRRAPFGDPVPQPVSGPVAAVTRARIRPARTAAFWSAVPSVTSELRAADGLLADVGIGEAPIGLQGTFSLWRSADDLSRFAHGTPAHRAAIRRTPEEGWYAEELFARFAVLDGSGTVDGRDPLA